MMVDENLTMTQMAKRLKMKLSRLSHWLNGRTKPSSNLDTLDEALAAIPKLSKSEYAWLAGFVEADGCVSILKSGGRESKSEKLVMSRFGIALIVNQKDPRPINYLVAAFGGRVRSTYKKHASRRKRYFVWALRANQAYAALVHLLPHMKVKRDQALLAIAMQGSVNEWRNKFGRYAARPDQVIAYRRDLYFKCKHLNSQSHIEDLNTASGEFGGSLRALMAETIPSEAGEGSGSPERVTASSPSPNSNASQERPTNVFHFDHDDRSERAG